jgi:hypothetical protein
MNETPTTASAAVQDPQRLGIIASRGAGWMKFLGVVSILEGALAVLTLWGILFAWLPIWPGHNPISILASRPSLLLPTT